MIETIIMIVAVLVALDVGQWRRCGSTAGVWFVIAGTAQEVAPGLFSPPVSLAYPGSKTGRMGRVSG
jgi:hypothetical protein